MQGQKKILSLLITLTPFSVHAQMQQDSSTTNKSAMTDSVHQINEVVVMANQMLGSQFEARNRTGSAYYVSPKELGKFDYTDINRMLKSVPGVNIYEEDGFGLRPNISLRGTQAERSERITLMEDGILAAPAPYAAPAAYYFPNAARMYAIEVLKGSSQVQYGPFTTGGAINLVSTPIPEELSIKANISAGSFGTFKTHTAVGKSFKYTGFLVEYLRHQARGFRHDEPDQRTGFKRNDVIVKFMARTQNEGGINHRVELKYGFANETSDETYLGLTDHDFALTPYFRYAGAQKDYLVTRHTQLAATYIIKGERAWNVTTQAYYNYFFRNWYKLNEVRTGYTSDERRSIGDVLADPVTNKDYFRLVTGEANYLGEALMLRANRRTYRSRGVQTKAEYKTLLSGGYLTAEVGLRYHADSEDRYQQDDGYAMNNGQMSLFKEGLPGSQANRITTAHAFAAYALAKWAKGAFTLTAGVRYEDVHLLNRDYTKADWRRTGMVRIETPNSAHALMPGVGVNCRLSSEWSVFAGLHKGFAPPSATLGQKAESSINIETGVRYANKWLKGELIGFNNNYANMLGSDLTALGGLGTLDQFNVGQALVRGIELLLQCRPLPSNWKIQLPLQLSYTFTDTQMKNSFTSAAWGHVVYGDEIPYIFRNALNGQVGIESKWIDLNFNLRYNGDMRTVPGQGRIAEREKIPANFIIDATAKGHIMRNLDISLSAVNLTNRVYMVSRHPSGVRAGLPLGIYGGIQWKL